MDDPDKYCFVLKKKVICVDTRKHERDTFDASREHMIHTVESSKNTSPYRIEARCTTQGVECFKRNLYHAGIFVVLFLIAGLLLNLLHELVHYSFLVMIGITDVSLTFWANGGVTFGSLPAFNDPTIPWFWWIFQLLGPLVIVNFFFLLSCMFIVKQIETNPVYEDRTTSQNIRWIGKNFLKAMAYRSGFIILMNTIFFPFYKLAFEMIGFSTPPSDTELLWIASLYMGEPGGTITRILLVFSVGIMVTSSVLFMLLYNRREMGP